jgi:hypothetical protein
MPLQNLKPVLDELAAAAPDMIRTVGKLIDSSKDKNPEEIRKEVRRALKMGMAALEALADDEGGH